MTATNESPVDSAVGVGDIELRVPADVRHLPVVRSLAAAIALREDFDLDFVADLKLAVDEACSLLASAACEGSDLRFRFQVLPEQIRMTGSVRSLAAATPEPDSFAWKVLTTLTDAADSYLQPGAGGEHLVVIELVKRGAGA